MSNTCDGWEVLSNLVHERNKGVLVGDIICEYLDSDASLCHSLQPLGIHLRGTAREHNIPSSVRCHPCNGGLRQIAGQTKHNICLVALETNEAVYGGNLHRNRRSTAPVQNACARWIDFSSLEQLLHRDGSQSGTKGLGKHSVLHCPLNHSAEPRA